MVKVFIDGSVGTTGLRIHERIAGQSDIQLLQLPEAERKSASARREMLREADIAFLCLPDEAAREAVHLAQHGNTRIIDASTAHRTAPGWVYGLPELSPAQRAAIKSGRRIAVPGCHASGFIAIIYPLIETGALNSNALLTCTSITGYSGGGKPMIAEYTGQERQDALDSPQHYATAQAHKHLPEMQAYTGLHTAPVFNPIVGDYYAGMLVSVPLHTSVLRGLSGLASLQALYERYYAGQRMIRVLPYEEANAFLPANACAGKDTMELFMKGNKERVTLYARYDNLGKGASGAAIQCMNIMLGKEESCGLSL